VAAFARLNSWTSRAPRSTIHAVCPLAYTSRVSSPVMCILRKCGFWKSRSPRSVISPSSWRIRFVCSNWHENASVDA